jgi:hypothetical protein
LVFGCQANPNLLAKACQPPGFRQFMTIVSCLRVPHNAGIIGHRSCKHRGVVMNKPIKRSRHRRFDDQFQAIGQEMSRLAIACDIDLFEKNVGERILREDESVCGQKNTVAFQKLRRLLMAFYPLELKTIDRLGAAETEVILEQAREAIRELRKFGRPGS